MSVYQDGLKMAQDKLNENIFSHLPEPLTLHFLTYKEPKYFSIIFLS